MKNKTPQEVFKKRLERLIEHLFFLEQFHLANKEQKEHQSFDYALSNHSANNFSLAKELAKAYLRGEVWVHEARRKIENKIKPKK